VKKILVSAAALVAAVGSANADFLLTQNNAAFNPSFTNPAWGASLSNANKPYAFNTSGGVTGAEGSMFTDAPGAFTASSLGTSPLRAFKWGFRNAGGASGGTAGKGLSGTVGGHSSYTQTFSAGSSTGTIAWGDIFESSRSRLDASISYTLTDGPSPGQALMMAVATFKNRAATTETYDFFNLVDSQILGIGAGSNDAVAASVSGSANIITFSDTVASSLYSLNFVAIDPSRWEVNTSTNINTKTFSGASATPTQYLGTGGSTAGVLNGSGDLFGAFSWRVTLAPGASVSLTSYVGVNMVPTPGALALLGVGGLVAGRRRR
jgi:hypothetical protein